MKPVRIIAIASLCLCMLYGLSHVGVERNGTLPVIRSEGFNRLNADENAWAGVRGAATLVRSTNVAMNTIFAQIASLAPISKFLSGTINVEPNNYPGYYIRLSDADTTVSADLGGKTFSNTLEVWYCPSAGNYTKALEFFFDSYSDPTSGEGVLLVIRSYYFNTEGFYPYETYMVRYKKDGSDVTHMVITASNYYGAPASDHTFKYGDTYNPYEIKSVKYRTRLSIDETHYAFAGLAQTNRQVTEDDDCLPLSVGTSYYTLVFLANTEAPNYSMAKFGLKNTYTAGVFDLCGNNPNPFNYGYFKSTEPYFVYDQVDAVNPVIAGYPTKAEVDAVTLEDLVDDELDVSSLPTEVVFNSTDDPV